MTLKTSKLVLVVCGSGFWVAIAQSLDASKAKRVYFIPAYLCLGLPGPLGTKLYLNEL